MFKRKRKVRLFYKCRLVYSVQNSFYNAFMDAIRIDVRIYGIGSINSQARQVAFIKNTIEGRFVRYASKIFS